MKATEMESTKKLLLKKAASTKLTTKPVSKSNAAKIKTNKPVTILSSGAKVLKPFTIVAIGASAGGLEAVTLLLQNLSPKTGMAFIYVQHLSPDHKSILPMLLSKATEMKVQDIDDMEKLNPDNVYVIPYNKEIEVTDGHIQLIPRPVLKTSNLSIDVLFSSLAETHKENVVGIVLSGSANDGTRGLKEIKQAGGITFAQDDSAKFTSMPHSAIASGIVDFVLSPKEIAMEINWMSEHPLLKRKSVKISPEEEIENNNPDLKSIIALLHNKKSVDFSFYKMNTIKRRILRRMLIHKIKTLNQYLELLSRNHSELELLYQDLLINVTDFFRDIEAFTLLKKTVLPRLLKMKTPGETLRIWVAACATGEEVYSIAMLLLELMHNRSMKIPFQIFASDLSATAINEARIGEYAVHQLKNVTPKRLQQFFVKSKDKYRISKSLRDVCVFAQHNVLRDPPFSRMDFISCRNLLIYLDTAAQKKAMATFHYALNERGCLFLGKSETIGTSTQLFSVWNKKYKIYLRKKNSGVSRIPDLTSRISPIPNKKIDFIIPEKFNTVPTVPKKNVTLNSSLGLAFDAALLSSYVPASVVVNYDLEILQFRGDTSMYLQHSSGKASFNILKMAHFEITFELRNAIHHAIKTKQIVRKTGIEISRDAVSNMVRIVNIEVSPFNLQGEEPMLIIVFTGQQQIETADAMLKTGRNNSLAKDRRIKKLEEEIAAARADMGSITHDQEAANEELQSANEEIVSSNEELQSLNEELETSKEEIESTNEELTTSNQELLARMQQVEELYTYYETILSTFHEPMLILDKDIRIKSANTSFCKMFQVNEEESIGMSLYKLSDNLWNIPRLRELLENIVPKNTRFHNYEMELNSAVIGHKIMLLNAHRIIQQSVNEELIVLTIADITEVRRLALELQLKERKVLEMQLDTAEKLNKVIEDSNIKYNMMLMQSPFAFAILKGKEMVIMLANDSVKQLWGKGKRIEGKSIYKVLPEIVNSTLPGFLTAVFETGIPFNGYELLTQLKRNGKMESCYFNFVYQPYREADATISGVTIIAYEVTRHVNRKEELIVAKNLAEQKTLQAEDAVKAKQQFLSNMSHEIRTPMNAIMGFTNVVLKTKLDKQQLEYLNAIKVSGDALIVLINDILDLAKVDSGKMTFEHIVFNMSDSISTMLQLFEQKIKEKNLNFELIYDSSIPKVLMGDPMRLRQIILNLMSNAVKFTKDGKIIMILRLLGTKGNSVTIEFLLSDTGIGIKADRLEHIFNNFEQAHIDTTSSYGGTGLGLAIVKQLVEQQGGTINVTSKTGVGSTFGFVLSFEKIDAKAETAFQNKPEEFQKVLPMDATKKNVSVLVAEDVALNQLLIKIILTDFGFDIDLAANGKIAIEKLKNNAYDIVLMDLQMPEMNGFEATDFIRKTMHMDIPIIALTADVTGVDVEKCKTVGLNDYISKPIDEKLLYSKMMKFITPGFLN